MHAWNVVGAGRKARVESRWSRGYSGIELAESRETWRMEEGPIAGKLAETG